MQLMISLWPLEEYTGNWVDSRFLKCQDGINPCHTELFLGYVKLYLHFLWFLYSNMAQVVEILPHGRQGPVCPSWLISWLLMAWRCLFIEKKILTKVCIKDLICLFFDNMNGHINYCKSKVSPLLMHCGDAWVLGFVINIYSQEGNWRNCQTSNITCTLVGIKTVDHIDVVGASPVGAAPTTSSIST